MKFAGDLQKKYVYKNLSTKYNLQKTYVYKDNRGQRSQNHVKKLKQNSRGRLNFAICFCVLFEH